MFPSCKAGVLALALLALPIATQAAPPYTRNTGGTTADGTLDALTDLYGQSGCIYNSALLTLANGQRLPLQCDVNGNLKVTGGGGGGGGGGTVTQGAQGSSASPWFVQQTGALPAGANAIGSVTLGGTLPAFTATPTVNVGTLPALPTGANAIGGVAQSGSWNVGGYNLRAFASVVRPANTTTYASGQLVANSTTAGSVAPLSFTVARTVSGTGFIRRVKLSKTGTSLTGASFRLHLYRDSPALSNGDGGAWLTTASIYLGAFDVTMDKGFTDQASGIGLPVVGSEVMFDTAAGSQAIYGLIEARGAYTPVSGETFTATLEVWPN